MTDTPLIADNFVDIAQRLAKLQRDSRIKYGLWYSERSRWLNVLGRSGGSVAFDVCKSGEPTLYDTQGEAEEAIRAGGKTSATITVRRYHPDGLTED